MSAWPRDDGVGSAMRNRGTDIVMPRLAFNTDGLPIMSTAMWIVAAVLAAFLAYALAAPTVLNFRRFLGWVPVHCPHRHTQANIRLNPLAAALTGAYGRPRARVRRCDLRGRTDTCDEACLDHLER